MVWLVYSLIMYKSFWQHAPQRIIFDFFIRMLKGQTSTSCKYRVSVVLCVRFTVSLRFELQGGHSKLSTSLATDKNGP